MSIRDDIAEHMRNKTSEELIGIWTKNDRTERSDLAFEAIKQVLTERGVLLPQQDSQPVQIPNPPSLIENAPKKSKAFLWWGGFIVVGFFWFGPGKAVFSSGNPIIFLAAIAGLSLSAAICALWFWLSGIRSRRSIFPRIIGTIFFLLGSMAPVAACIHLGSSPPVLAISIIGVEALVFLGLAYLLMFRIKNKSDK